ncbi:MAG: tetratricopeptide repeat-containing sensor histidine kinase [Bacteroidota bacterium]
MLAAIITACTPKQSNDSEYSAAFKPIYDSTNSLFEKNKFDAALHYLDSATQNLKLTPTDKSRKYGFHYVINNKIKHDNVQALLYADSLIAIGAQLTDKPYYISFLGDANFARGDALFELGRYNESYVSYYQGYLLGKSNLDNCTLSAYTYRMGMITYKQANYKFAASYFKKSFEQNKSCKDEFVSFFRQQEVLDNTALSYRNLGNLDSAIIYFNTALKYINDNAPKYKTRGDILEVARAVIYGNQADVLSTQGKYTQAVDLLKKSIATNLKKGNDNHDAQLSEIKLVQLYMNLHQDALILPLLTTIRGQLDSIKASDAEAGWNLMMGTYFKNKNQLAQSMPYMEKYHRLKDSLNERTRSLKENNVNEQVANLEKQYQIVDLRNKQRIYIYTAIIFAAMSSIIILLIFRNWKRSRQEMDIVTALNKQVNMQKHDLENTLADLENSSQEKDRMLRTVAHDLRNPLGGIASLTSAMVEDADYNNEQIELLKIIKETAFDSLELINEILEATSSSPVPLQKQPVDINALLNNSVELLRFKAAEKNQKIMLNTLQAPEELMISREKIWRVISNLISNAIKFSPVGAIICVSITNEADEVQITVNDHGIGIPDEIKSQVFNMFTNAKRPGTLGEKSFGLGLSICRQIIEKHHGKIWFESNTQDGTTFYVRLSKINTPVSDNAAALI